MAATYSPPNLQGGTASLANLGAEWVLSRKAGFPPPSMRKVRVHILCGVKIILCGVKMETITGQDLEIATLRLY